MRYPDAASFRQALEQRLKERSAGDGARLARDRKRVAFDRFLARLAAVAPDGWMLKGGFAIDLRLGDRARATKDIDLDWCVDDDELLDALLDAADHDAGDYFAFRVERSATPADRLGGSQRFRVSASLAGRPFETFPIDIAFRADQAATDMLTTADLLAFAGLAPVRVPALSLETQVAEKLHAYTRTYEGGRPSSRTKDLVDIVLIAELFALDARALAAAIEATFTTRGTHPVPQIVPRPSADWSTPFSELAATVGIATDLAAAHAVATDLLTPILDGSAHDGVWAIASQRWIPR